MNSPFSLYKKYGFGGLFRQAWRKIIKKTRSVIRKRFFNKYIYYRYDKSFLSKEIEAPEGLEHHRFEKIIDIPKQLAEQLLDPDMERGGDYWKIVEKEFAKGCVFCLSTKDGELACSLWSRRSKGLKNWHIPLKDEDVLFFVGVVRVKWRGLRILPLQLQYLVGLETQKGGDAYCDIVEWNQPSINACTRAGFTQIGIGRKLSEDE